MFSVLTTRPGLGGSIHQNYDLLLRYSLYITAEMDLRVRHCLLCLPGVQRSEIKATGGREGGEEEERKEI